MSLFSLFKQNETTRKHANECCTRVLASKGTVQMLTNVQYWSANRCDNAHVTAPNQKFHLSQSWPTVQHWHTRRVTAEACGTISLSCTRQQPATSYMGKQTRQNERPHRRWQPRRAKLTQNRKKQGLLWTQVLLHLPGIQQSRTVNLPLSSAFCTAYVQQNKYKKVGENQPLYATILEYWHTQKKKKGGEGGLHLHYVITLHWSIWAANGNHSEKFQWAYCQFLK